MTRPAYQVWVSPHFQCTRPIQRQHREQGIDQRQTQQGPTERLAAGRFGHIGLRESALAVMDTLGWPVDEGEVIAKRAEICYTYGDGGQ